MKTLLSIIAFSTLLIGCDSNSAEKIANETSISDVEFQLDSTPVRDTTPRITGIGGIFYKSNDPVATKEWYAQHLGMKMNDWGSSFEFRNALRPSETNYLQWSVFNDSTSYLDPSQSDFMINYRVQNIEGLVRKMRASGVNVLDSIASYEYGKFVHILDRDGNKIELWEPVDEVLTEMGGVTNK
ncbi:VOC family protein [Phaeocystidibacter marisrubri]|uniref:VOC family protein n=1 Tax=Phaeocystidibacter marisrubri TaxID=1577780 RepID=UPI0019B166EA|nr:VOC family protein [Phaeocystidibacter marisrubri]GGH75624.1 hypothetical protein GCM10011318_22840 [Phaeocystidibacter marisrubri]